MRMYAGDAARRVRRARARALRRRPAAGRGRAGVAGRRRTWPGALSYCDEYAAAEEVLGRALEATRRAGWVTWVGGRHRSCGRGSGCGPDRSRTPSRTRRTAVEIFSGGLQLYLPASAYCLIRGAARARRAGRGARRSTSGSSGEVDRRRGSSPRGSTSRAGAWPPHRGEHERRAGGVPGVRRADRERAGRQPVDVPLALGGRPRGAAPRARVSSPSELIAEETALAERFGAPRALGVARRAGGAARARAGGRGRPALGRGAVRRLWRPGRARAHAGRARRRDPAQRPPRRRPRDRCARRWRLADADGALAIARRAREEIALTGGRAPARRDGAAELTPSEQRVAALAAGGRTQPADRRRALRDRQGRRVAPRQRVPQARHPRSRRARRGARRALIRTGLGVTLGVALVTPGRGSGSLHLVKQLPPAPTQRLPPRSSP